MPKLIKIMRVTLINVENAYLDT